MKGNIQILVKTDSIGTLDLTERAESYRFGTLQPGGLWQAQVVTLAPERDLWTLFDSEEQGTLEFWVHGEMVWSGDLSGLTLEPNKLTISAEGPVMRLKDPEIWRCFADSEYSRWETLDTDKFDKDTNDRLYFATRANVDYGDGERCRITWPESQGEAGGTVKRVSAHVELIAWGRAWTFGLKADGVEMWSEAVTGNPTGTANVHISAVEGRGVLADEYIEILNTGSLEKIITNFTLYSDATLLYTIPAFTMPAGQTIKVWSKAGTNSATELFMGLSAPAFVATAGLAILNNDSTIVRSQFRWFDMAVSDLDADAIEFYLAIDTGGFGGAQARVTQICVRTLYPTTNDGVLREILTGAGIAIGDVQSTGLTIDQAVYSGTQKGFDVVRDMAFLGDGEQSWMFAIYESGAVLKPWATTPDWLITRSDLQQWSIERSRANVINAVRARLPDKWFSEWFTDEASIARYRRREKTLPLQQTSQAEARRWAQIYLSELANVISSLRIEANALIRKPDNSLWPVALVRAGEVIALRDVIPQQDLLIRVAETQFNGATMQITPMGASSRLEVILARRQYERLVAA